MDGAVSSNNEFVPPLSAVSVGMPPPSSKNNIDIQNTEQTLLSHTLPLTQTVQWGEQVRRMVQICIISIRVLFPVSMIEECENSTSSPTDTYSLSSFMNTETCEWCYHGNIVSIELPVVSTWSCFNMNGMWDPWASWDFCGPNSWWNGANRAHSIQLYDESYNLALCVKHTDTMSF